MAKAKTGIQWTQATWNPVVGCSRVSEGCRNCYAETMARRIACAADAREDRGEETTETQRAYQRVVKLRTHPDAGSEFPAVRLPQWNGNVVLIDEKLTEPLRVKTPTMWFVNSMSDLFHERLRFEDIDRIFAVMALCPQHTFQVLTKRPERMAEYLSTGYAGRVGSALKRTANAIGHASAEIVAIDMWHQMQFGGLRNVWVGTSAEDQTNLDKRLPHLLKCPAAVRFLSLEPLLGPIDLRGRLDGIGWVIVGGESGHGARPCNVAWIRDIVRQCREAGVPVFVKQLGARPVAEEGVDYRRALTIDGPVAMDNALGMDAVTVSGPKATVTMQVERVMIHADGFMGLRDSHGGDMAEWPDDLRVREMPGLRSPD